MMNSTPDSNQLRSRQVALFSLRSLLLGVVPMVVVLTLLVGSLNTAATIIAMSIICTLGVGAAFWVGVAMLLGASLQVLLPSLRGSPRQASSGSRVGGEPHASDVEGDRVRSLLLNYAAGRLRLGASEEGVRRDLERAGWGERLISSVLEEARGGAAAMADDTHGPGSDADAG